MAVDHSLWRIFRNKKVRQQAIDLIPNLGGDADSGPIWITVLGRFINQDENVLELLQSIVKRTSKLSVAQIPGVIEKASAILKNRQGIGKLQKNPPTQKQDLENWGFHPDVVLMDRVSPELEEFLTSEYIDHLNTVSAAIIRLEQARVLASNTSSPKEILLYHNQLVEEQFSEIDRLCDEIEEQIKLVVKFDEPTATWWIDRAALAASHDAAMADLPIQGDFHEWPQARYHLSIVLSGNAKVRDKKIALTALRAGEATQGSLNFRLLIVGNLMAFFNNDHNLDQNLQSELLGTIAALAADDPNIRHFLGF